MSTEIESGLKILVMTPWAAHDALLLNIFEPILGAGTCHSKEFREGIRTQLYNWYLFIVRNTPGGGGGGAGFWTPTTPQLTVGRRPLFGWGGGQDWRGGSGRGEWGGWGGLREGHGGFQVGQFGVVVGGFQMGRFGVLGGGRGAQAPLTSPCPPSNHNITIDLTLTFAAS